jgi:putative endonuclease
MGILLRAGGLPFNLFLLLVAPIAQLDRAADYGSAGYRFNSYWVHQPSPAAEQGRRLPRRSAFARRRAGSTKNGGLRLGTPANFQMKFSYVYILQSEINAEHFYVGFTEDLQTRLKAHNAGQVPYSAKFRPWRIKTAIAFSERQRAIEFERYLKSASGRAFAKKRF